MIDLGHHIRGALQCAAIILALGLVCVVFDKFREARWRKKLGKIKHWTEK